MNAAEALMRAAVDILQVPKCMVCGADLPAYSGVGRPRKRCESCAPPRRGSKVFSDFVGAAAETLP